jgi:hypothetical protein
MRIKILLLIAFSYFNIASFGQQKRFSFQGAVLVGLLEGEKGSAFQIGAMGGIKSKTWIASLGSGLDYYSVRSIPVYLNVQKNIFNNEKTPFVYLGGGYHFLWLPKLTTTWAWPENSQTKGGLYYQAGIGYQVPALKKSSLFFAAGFSEKQYDEDHTQVYPCLVWPCPEYKEKISYRLRRLSITTGLRF